MHRLAVRAVLVLVAAPVLLLSACGTGSDDPTNAAPTTQDGSSSAVRTLPPAQALALIDERDPVVLDVRTPQEYASGHLTGARNMALGDDFATAVGALPRTATYVLYCASGNGSAQAATILADMGFTDVVDAGGLSDLAAAGGEVVT